jgi:hypothetical protein
MQLSRLYNKRVQNEAKGSLEGSGTRVEPLATAREAEPAGLNITHVDVR